MLASTSFLPIVEAVDSFPYTEPLFYWKFLAHDGNLLGYITPDIADRFDTKKNRKNFVVVREEKNVRISESLDSFDARNKVFASVALDWKRTDVLLNKGWRDELYTVYYPRATPYILLERAFSCLLGVVTYGVHINGFIPAENTKEKKAMKIWVPRRSLIKATYPNKLDNTIAGGLGYPHGLWETLVKECYEEGGLDEAFVTKNITAAGAVTYICQPYGPEGHAQPEIEYVYDLVFPSETENVPHPVDGESQDFKLMEIDEIREKILQGEFKPNCALVLCDFLVRHGFMTAENEPNYLEILSRLHRRFPFALRN